MRKNRQSKLWTSHPGTLWIVFSIFMLCLGISVMNHQMAFGQKNEDKTAQGAGREGFW